MTIVFLDTETTGLDPHLHDVWEIAVITHPTETDEASGEHHWIVRPDLSTADPKALEIGRYYERTTHLESFDNPEKAASELAPLLEGALVIGSNPAFDERFLTRWLRTHGHAWRAHYRTVDAITLGWGYLMAADPDNATHIPPSSHAVSRALGIDPDAYDRHTALGDAWWVHDLYMHITAPTLVTQ